VSAPGEPAVVTVIAHTSGSGDPGALADILVLDQDGRASADHCADLFDRYPGLSLAVIKVAAGTIDIGLRDGSLLTSTRPSPAGQPAPTSRP
jgi:hypothetical protein